MSTDCMLCVHTEVAQFDIICLSMLSNKQYATSEITNASNSQCITYICWHIRIWHFGIQCHSSITVYGFLNSECNITIALHQHWTDYIYIKCIVPTHINIYTQSLQQKQSSLRTSYAYFVCCCYVTSSYTLFRKVRLICWNNQSIARGYSYQI